LGAITVGVKYGKYRTISAALKDNSSNVYFIYAGNYTEQVVVSRPNVKIYGQTSAPSSYTRNRVTIENNVSAYEAGGDDECGTVRIVTGATDVALYNLNILNKNKNGPGIALSVYDTRFGGYALNISGFQDTLLAQSGYQFISRSVITGAVDYIFGQYGSLWITKSTLQSTGNGHITASGRASDDSTYYVIDSSNITGAAHITSYLGRPWRNYARVVFQKCFLSSIVSPDGWSQWNPGDARTDEVTFAEFNNNGPGASAHRASFSTQLSSPIDIKTVLGSNTTWIDANYL